MHDSDTRDDDAALELFNEDVERLLLRAIVELRAVSEASTHAHACQRLSARDLVAEALELLVGFEDGA